MSEPGADETAQDLLARNRYAVLATVDADGVPWATPVWFAHHGLDLVLWVSAPDTRHSRNLAADPRIALTVFDSHVEPGRGTAFFGRGRAEESPEQDRARHLVTYSERSRAQGMAAWDDSRVTGEAHLRLYVARLEEVSVLLDVDGPERRVPVATGRA